MLPFAGVKPGNPPQPSPGRTASPLADQLAREGLMAPVQTVNPGPPQPFAGMGGMPGGIPAPAPQAPALGPGAMPAPQQQPPMGMPFGGMGQPPVPGQPPQMPNPMGQAAQAATPLGQGPKPSPFAGAAPQQPGGLPAGMPPRPQAFG